MAPMTKYIIVFVLMALAVSIGNAQEYKDPAVRGTVIEGDTLLHMDLPQFEFYAPRVFKNRFDEYRYRRLVQNVKKVYPFARLAGAKFEEYSEMLASIEKESHRRKAMEEAEKELRIQFEDDLKRLTFTQGLILLKLVDRETSHTSYDLVKEFRGNLSAMFWQSLGRFFGFNLRTQYDPQGEDAMIEEIVQLIEAGLI